MQGRALPWCPGRLQRRLISDTSQSLSVMMALMRNLCGVVRGPSCCAQADR